MWQGLKDTHTLSSPNHEKKKNLRKQKSEGGGYRNEGELRILGKLIGGGMESPVSTQSIPVTHVQKRSGQ